MATINTGLGGSQGVGEGSFRGTTLNTANGGTGNYDDGSLRVNITSVFGPSGINYFGTNYTSIYINTNGLITFRQPPDIIHPFGSCRDQLSRHRGFLVGCKHHLGQCDRNE